MQILGSTLRMCCNLGPCVLSVSQALEQAADLGGGVTTLFERQDEIGTEGDGDELLAGVA